MARLVWLYSAFQFFFGMLLWLPIFYVYQERMGLSEAEIFQIQSLYQIVFCFLEVPTGYFADRKGYLSSMKIGAVTLIVANLLPIFAVDYAGFLIHFCLIALARSFISGASAAYLYEACLERGEPERYKQIEGEARAYGLIGKVVGWAGVGAMMEWHLTLPYWLTVVAAVLSFGFALALPRLRTTRAGTPSLPAESGLTPVVAAFQEVARRPVLLLLMLQGVAIFVLSRVAQVTLFQPILVSKQLPVGTFGLVMSAMTLFEAVGSWKPQIVRRWINDLHLVTLITFALAVLTGLLPWLGPWMTVAALCVFSLFVGWSFPVQKQVMNDAILDSRRRATLLSFESIVDRGISALVTLLLASYMSSMRMDAFLRDTALATMIGMVVIGVLASRYWERDDNERLRYHQQVEAEREVAEGLAKPSGPKGETA